MYRTWDEPFLLKEETVICEYCVYVIGACRDKLLVGNAPTSAHTVHQFVDQDSPQTLSERLTKRKFLVRGWAAVCAPESAVANVYTVPSTRYVYVVGLVESVGLVAATANYSNS